MLNLPQDLPENDPKYGRLFAHINRLSGCIQALNPLQSRGTRTGRTSLGVTREAQPGQPASEPGKAEQFLVNAVHKDHLLAQRVTFSTVLNGLGAEVTTRTLEDEIVQIAKPHILRVTPWNRTDRLAATLTEDVDGLIYRYVSNGNAVDTQTNAWNYREVEIKGPITSSQDPYAEPYPVATKLREMIWPHYIPGSTVILAAKVEQSPAVRHPSIRIATSPVEIFSEDVTCEWVDLNDDGRTWQMLWRPVKICVDNGDGTYTSKSILVRSSQPYS